MVYRNDFYDSNVICREVYAEGELVGAYTEDDLGRARREIMKQMRKFTKKPELFDTYVTILDQLYRLREIDEATWKALDD